MTNLETAYSQAMETLQKGRSKEEVLLEFAEFKNELAPLLDISLSLLTLPKNIAPQPAMQRKYALAPSKGFWLNWIHISKFVGVSMSLMLLLSALTVTGYAAVKSGPGQALFGIKKLAEQSQMILAYNQNQKANIQLAITQQRLDDAKQIFADPSSNIEQKTAALNELADQTSSAVAVVNSVADSDPKSAQNPPLLTSLDSIAQQQQNLLTNIQPDSQITVTASSALQSLSQTASKISQIQQYVAVATSDQSLTQLSSDPNAVAVLGNIDEISANQITVEKTTFSLTEQTSITDPAGNILSFSDLTLKTKVNVLGEQTPTALLAEQIIVQNNASTQPEVQADATQTPSATSTATTTVTSTADASSTKASVDNKDVDNSQTQDSSSTSASVQPNPNTATGSYILENPAPQYAPN